MCEIGHITYTSHEKSIDIGPYPSHRRHSEDYPALILLYRNHDRNDDPGLLQAERRVVRLVGLLSFGNSRHDRLLIYRPSVYQRKSSLDPFHPA